jgi:hypothetical protein
MQRDTRDVQQMSARLGPSLLLLMSVTLILGAAGCGSTGATGSDSASSSYSQPTHIVVPTPVRSTPRPSKPTVSRRTYKANQRTYQAGGSLHRSSAIERFGRAASAVESVAIAQTVKSYFAALAARRYARACTMLSRGLMTAITQVAARPAQGNNNCGAALSLLVKPVEIPRVREARVRGVDGYALIRTKAAPSEDDEIPIHRENGVWRIDATLATPVSAAAPPF